MKIHKIAFLIFILTQNTNNIFAQQDIFVSANGTNTGLQAPTISNPINTLENAYLYIQNNLINASNEVITAVNIYLMSEGGDVLLSQTNNTLTWTVSGTSIYPITITSYDCRTTLKRNSEGGHMLYFYESNYINIKNIDFVNVTAGAIFIDEGDYIDISYCSFSGGSTLVGPNQDTGIIYVGVVEDYTGFNCATSTGNKISYNYFHNMEVTAEALRHHAIYVSRGSTYNQVYGNTIKFPPAYGIHLYHGDYDNNTIYSNLISRKDRVNNQDVTGIEIGYWDDEDFDNGGPSEVFDNIVYNNYVYDGDNTNVVDIETSLDSINTVGNNYRYETSSPNDPYWIGYDAAKITDRVVTGDFDNDGKMDDIAAFYDYGSETRLHVWRGEVSGYSFNYSGSTGWWIGSTYTSAQISKRVVSGDFDNDNFKDDIAVFYDYGNSSTQMHVFYSNGSSFGNPIVRWTTSGYDASKISGKIVNGDFDRDGYEDDIAAFYNYGTNETRIHVWKCNLNTSFTYSGSTGWWSTLGYNSEKINDRIVSGDFDNDGFKDDIVAFFDYGSSETRIHCWQSTGSSFSYSGSAGWWSSLKYSWQKIVPNVVSGDFDNDGYKDDIATFFGTSLNQTRINVWRSNSTSFIYEGITGWWNSDGYTSNNIVGRVVSGDFDGDGNYDDISAFYNYSSNCGSVRSHVWRSNLNSFTYMNESLGFPWIAGVYDYSGMIVQNSVDSRDEIKENGLIIYPNPTSGEVNIGIQNDNSILLLFDSKGTILLTEKIDRAQEHKINMNTYSKGVYYLKLINNNESICEKIILE